MEVYNTNDIKSAQTMYSYDKNNRLLNAVTTYVDGTTQREDYTYDANGNRTMKTASGTTKKYDYAQVMAGDGSGYGVTMYSYDVLGRMSGMQSGDTTASYTYDGAGLRQSKTVNGVTTSYVYDGTDVVREGSTYYTRGAAGLISKKSGTKTAYYYTDYHGSVVRCGDEAYSYDAFGNQTSETEDSNPFRYAAEYWDSESGLIYLRARYYDSGVGAFMSEDPARDGLNWYSYCAGNPVNFVDPSGNHEETIQKMITISNLKMIYINGDHSKSVQTRASNARRYIMNESPLRQYAIFNAITTYYFSDTSRNTLASMIPLIDIAYYTGAAYYMTHDYVSQNDAIAHDMFNPAHDVQSGMVYHIFAFEQQYMQSDSYGRKVFNGLVMELRKESTPQGSVWTLYLENPVNGQMEERAQIRTSEQLGVEVLRNDSLDYSPPKEHGIH